jgi:ABC-2 type transport system permease protein
VRALSRLTVVELKLFLRDPAAYFWTLIFPLVLVVILGSIPGFRKEIPELGSERLIDLYVPIFLVMTFAFLGLFITPVYLVSYREKGILRRLATTPIGSARVLIAQLAVQAATAAVAAILIMGTAAVAFGVDLPHNVGAFLVAFLPAATSSLSVGLFVAAVVRTSKAASGLGSALFFPLMFLAGLYLPREAMPTLLIKISDFTYLGAAVQALRDASEGAWPSATAVLVMLGYAVIAGLAAIRLFRWE